MVRRSVRKLSQWKDWALAVLYMGVVMALAVVPVQMQAPILDRAPSDKFMHGVIYGLMVVLLWRAMRYTELMLVPVLIAGLHGLVAEGLQLLVPARSFEALDLAADAVGILAAYAFIEVWRQVLQE